MEEKLRRALMWLVVLGVFVLLMIVASLLTEPEGAKLSGVAWLLWTAIAAVGIYIVYFATSESEAWVVGTRQVVYMAIGAALYGVFCWIFNVIPMPSISLVALRPAVCIPIFFGYIFGPVVGFFTGAVGNVIGDFLTGWGVFPVWDIGNGFMGMVPGLALLFPDKRRGLNALTLAVEVLIAVAIALIIISPIIPHPWTGEATNFGGYIWVLLIAGAFAIGARLILARFGIEMAAVNIWGALGIIIGIGFASIADIWISGYTFLVTMIGQFVPAAGPNIINAVVLVPILLGAYRAVQVRMGR
jgi:uncharacterized membrane protein